MPEGSLRAASPPELLAGVRAVLFDLDGTLVTTHIDFGLMKRRMLALVTRAGVPAEAVAELDILSVLEAARTYLDEAVGLALRQEGWRELERMELNMCSNPQLVCGAGPLLSELRKAGLPVGIVTRNCRRVALRLLEHACLEHDVLVAREDVAGRTKPDPEHPRAALRLLGNPTPALMVGDHWMDVQAGKAAGLATVGVLNGRSAQSFAPAMPDILVASLAELRFLLHVTLLRTPGPPARP